ncbi:hypothetical protein TREMEDRAFT_30239 [Tremella mesenterica DSM 1558]|uniref:uncharacterized protein n=1 Tax=Tremella mesenterica (strain ATCC 24925 / CBS 8224 / DSM 1558 / NBRC 9311 / NRRL Y-6157 / RJB 2259-6 / UBC 559-6) TaxID=578456 RepID=UPI0003F4A29A|nr:uncharacterized protein TREMEDRAFT_30239 [Tremella mesenterica DSM 1558]EIW69814.1 hypothetical protein TREMEDRAFT_30239 [Tremella mesenterica DSM 1558]
MSYASVASHNIPQGSMPQPDQNLADGHFAGETTASFTADDKKKSVRDGINKAEKEFDEVENKLAPYWEKTKDVVLRPGTLGGLMGVVNVGLLGTLGYFAYTRKDQPWDRRIIGGAVAGTLALFGAEGYVAESYLQTAEGRQEAERAKSEGSKFYLQAKEVILRPGVAGGLAGVLNVAIIGTISYFSYKHWNQPWDRRVVSTISVGLLGLSGLEGYVYLLPLVAEWALMHQLGGKSVRGQGAPEA